MNKLGIALLLAALNTTLGVARADDRTTRIEEMLESNATASAYARICDEPLVADQLKTSTMLLLTLIGMDPKKIQLGSYKYTMVIKREINAYDPRKIKVNCDQRVRDAKDRVEKTNGIIAASRRPEDTTANPEYPATGQAEGAAKPAQ